MARRTRTVAVLMVALAVLLAACGGASERDAAVAAEAEAPTAVAPLSGEFATIGGDAIDLGSLEGQDIVLWFWAPW